VLTWRIKQRSGFTAVELHGEITDDASFAELAAGLSGFVVLQLGEVTRLSSVGVREWIDFVSGLDRVSELVFSHCSTAVVGQLNTVSSFRGAAAIRSFYAPFRCEPCDRDELRLIDVQTHRPAVDRVPRFPCVDCGASMKLDDLPGRYLAFLQPS
jgi:hypothetical protein